MKKFLARILLFSALFVLILILKTVPLPYFIGNEDFAAKLKAFNKSSSEINSVIFGSSRLYRQVDPALYDSIISHAKLNTYNFATFGTFNPESYYLYSNFLRELEPGDLKIALLEIQSLRFYDPNNVKTVKGSYWNTVPILRYAINYIEATDLDEEKKEEFKQVYYGSFLFRLGNMSVLANLLENDLFREGSKGYYPLQDQVREDDPWQLLKTRYEDFHRDPSELQERIEAARNSSQYINAPVNTIHYEYLMDLITRSLEKEVHLIIVLPPRLTDEEYRELIPIVEKIPSSHVVQLHKLPEYSPFYDVKYSFDIAHLNTTGSSIFTKCLAQEVDKIINRIDQKEANVRF